MVFYRRKSDVGVANVKNPLGSSLLNIAFVKHKLFNTPDQRIPSLDSFHMRALDNGVKAAAEDAPPKLR